MKLPQEQPFQPENIGALETFASTITHDMNNILAIILGKTQLMQSRTSDHALREDLTVIEQAAWRAAETVRRLQVFVSGYGEILTSVNLNSLVLDVIKAVRDRGQEESGTVDMTPDLGEIPPILGNPVELRELLTHLIFSAAEDIPPGERLTVTTRHIDEFVELSVGETGAEMSEGAGRRIFDPFFRRQLSRQAGFGLPVVHQIIRKHRGGIEVESREGQSKTFRVLFQGLGRNTIAA